MTPRAIREVETMTSVDATASGVPYRVVTVNGEPAASLEQFAGETSFSVSKSGTESWVVGFGVLHDDVVRFHEKGTGGSKDVRVWQVGQPAEGTFTAETISSY
jgi:hypothetical protein